MADWYYEENGAQRGPIAEADLNTMLFNRLLHPDTRVWTESFGTSWKPASETQLQRAQAGSPPPLGRPTTPPPVADTSFGRGAALHAQASGVGVADGVSLAPAPRSLTWERLIAFMPLAGIVLDLAIIGISNVDPTDSNVGVGVTFWSFIISLWFAYKDWEAVYAAGLNPARRSMVWFMFLTPIGYFLRRRAIAKTPLAPMWIWLACAFLHAITIGLILS